MSTFTNLKEQFKSVSFVREIVERRRIKKKFATEMNLLNGVNPSKSTQPSIIHFSLNKSATQYVKKTLNVCVQESAMVQVHIQDYAFASQFPYLDQLSVDEMQEYKHIFKPKGYLYSAFGGLVEGIDNLDQYRVVLMVRDPRDIIVSDYYSIAYSHPEPTSISSKYEGFHINRKLVKHQSLEEFALQSWEKINGILERYRDQLLIKYPHVYVTKYEDMVSDFESWLSDLIRACQLEVSQKLKDHLIQQYYISRPKKENQQSQFRKGVSGDYKNKLSDETISFLNEKFSTVLDYYQYT